MRIGINGRFLVAKRTGVQRAAYNLLKVLVEIDRDNQYFIFTGAEQLTNPDWKYSNVTVVPSKIREGESFRNHFWEQFSLPRLADRFKVDLLHSPANIAPLFYRGNSIVHIHDLCFVVNPQWYSFSFRTVYNFIIPRLAQRAARVITNSNNSRNDLLQFFNLPAERVSLVYWAVDDLFLRRDKIKVDAENWPHSDYILYVGSLEPRKNIRALVEAYEHLRLNYPNIRTKLILIGGESPLFGDVRLKVKHFKEDVIFKGFVDDDLLRLYYRNAKLVVYPSLYEGFGLPPLEAMASGTPVITSTTSSIPEVVGDAALMVSPYEPIQLAEMMARVIQDPELSAKMRERGYKQVQKFNWYRVARHTLAVYTEVFNTHCREKSELTEDHFISFSTWQKLVAIEQSHLKPLQEAELGMGGGIL